ncbi:hypothetical protein [Mesorhizobium sp. 1B3]|uniref:hypothetical protein n=1 Tax=Mesorhizobium sp. 1B3 TaxID=3243599 RepID=UPI003D9924EA
MVGEAPCCGRGEGSGGGLTSVGASGEDAGFGARAGRSSADAVLAQANAWIMQRRPVASRIANNAMAGTCHGRHGLEATSLATKIQSLAGATVKRKIINGLIGFVRLNHFE